MHEIIQTDESQAWAEAVRHGYDQQLGEGVYWPTISQDLLTSTPGRDIFCRLAEIGLQINVRPGIGVYLSELSEGGDNG